MWFTTRFEGFDYLKNYTREPKGNEIITNFLSGLLRTGFLLKFISFTGLLITYYGYKGKGVFSHDLFNTTEDQRELSSFRIAMEVFSGLNMLGALYILFFQATLADDASWARGYRAGAKLLGNAVFFDVVSATLQFIIYVYMANHYDQVWWSQFTSGGVEWLISALSRLLNAFSMFFYASAFFLLEVYHDNGTNDWHGILNCLLFSITGISEITSLAFPNSYASVVGYWVTLVSVLIWAMAFEQEVNSASPLFTESELTNEVEAQVQKFARMSPYTCPN